MTNMRVLQPLKAGVSRRNPAYDEEVLSEVVGEPIAKACEVQAKVDFVLSWAESALVSVCSITKSSRLPAALSADEDERVPTELAVEVDKNAASLALSSESHLRVSVEVFRHAYQFDCRILNFSTSADRCTFVVDIPTQVFSVNNRIAPRYAIDPEGRTNLGPISWIAADGAVDPTVQIREIGLDSVALKFAQSQDRKEGRLRIGSTDFQATFVRAKEDLDIFNIAFDTSQKYGTFFDTYRKIAFPNLLPRIQLDYQALFELYLSTNYLSQFGESNSDDLRQKLFDTWREVESSSHVNSVDYVVVDDLQQLCGASSATRAFTTQSHDIWAFHQLCSIRTPAILNRSGDLYLWRAEYLLALPGHHQAVVWFRSASRWLERIYVKFARMVGGGELKLRPVLHVKGTIGLSRSDRAHNEAISSAKTIAFGRYDRSIAQSASGMLGGLGPAHLNSSGVLESVFHLASDPKDIDECMPVVDHLLNSAVDKKAAMYLTLKHGSEIPAAFQAGSSDRMVIIDKDDLFDFMICVEHSVELTKRKFEL